MEKIAYKKKVFWKEIEISKRCKDKFHVNFTMEAKVTVQISHSVATELLY